VSGQFHDPATLPPGKRAHGTHWIGGWVGHKTGLDNMERRKILAVSGLELWPLGCPAHSLLLYQLCTNHLVLKEFIKNKITSTLHLLLLLWLYSPLLGLGLLGWGISPSERPLPKHKINGHNTDIHALGGIWTHDPSVRASKNSSCLRPRSHCDWHFAIKILVILMASWPLLQSWNKNTATHHFKATDVYVAPSPLSPKCSVHM
jgi:hypothetical protein